MVADYYGMLMGAAYAHHTEAASDYFRRGWRLGVIPNPLLDNPAARFSPLVSLMLRNALAMAAWGITPPARLVGVPSRTLPDEMARSAVSGSWIAAMTSRAQSHPDLFMVRIGLREVTWREFCAKARELIPGAATIISSRVIDESLYRSQVGGNRAVSIHALLDDYIVNGELDGRTPHLFFEADWYREHDKSQARRGTPVNQFLDFVARGEVGPGGPHFSGQRYLASLEGHRPASLITHFVRHARDSAPTPACEGIVAAPVGEIRRRARARLEAYHRGLSSLSPERAPLRRHPELGLRAVADATAVVFVDGRLLDGPAAVDGLGGVIGQTIRGLRVIVAASEETARPAALDELERDHAALDVIDRSESESFGAFVGRFVREIGPDGWTLWQPGQSWQPEFLAGTVGALVGAPQVGAVAAVSSSLPQPWLAVEDALWLEDLDGAGVVFRGRGERVCLPEDALDFGIAARLLIEISRSGACGVLRWGDGVSRAEVSPSGMADFSQRVGLNAARRLYLADLAAPVQRGVGVVIPTFEDWRMTVTAVRRVLQTVDRDDLVVQVIDNGSARPVSSIIDTAFAADERVRVHRLLRNSDFAVGSTIGAADAARETIVFLNNDTSVCDGWLDPLLNALDDGARAVQPLLLYGERTVQSAGTAFFGGLSMPKHAFVDIHPADLPAHLGTYSFTALTAAALAMRHRDFEAIGGFDSHFINGMEDVDLCLRLKERLGAELRVCPEARVIHFESRTPGRGRFHFENRRRLAVRWRRTLLHTDDAALFAQGSVSLLDVRWTRPQRSALIDPVPIYGYRPLTTVSESAAPLRWAIKSSATGDTAGDSWGDTFFAEALAGALRRAGQHVVVDRAGSHSRPSSGWDDVTLTLRGLTRYIPEPGPVNLLWVISHPDLVTPLELTSGFDRVYSAGREWATDLSAAHGVDIRVMRQATDTTMFFPGRIDDAARRGVLFVGRTRGVARPIVTDVIAAGGRPDVYGDDGWEAFIDPVFVRASQMPNDEVPAAYSGAAIVLNDHWADMARNGFISNRLFDAAATGARIISDDVPGLEEIFGAQVRTYRDRAQLARILDPNADEWPDAIELRRHADRIVQEHSFDARAQTLVQDALALRATRGGKR